MNRRNLSMLLVIALIIAISVGFIPGALHSDVVKASGSSITDQLNGISSELVRVWGFDSGVWQMYDPTDPMGSDLTSLVEGHGYWITVNGECTLVYGSYVWSLNAGFNLIGWIETGQPTGNPGPDIANQLNSISSVIFRVWGYYDGAWQMYNPPDPVGSNLDTMIEGRGYWIAVDSACTLTYLNNSWSLTNGWNLIGWIEGGQHTASTQGSGSTSTMIIPPCRFHGTVQVEGANVVNGTTIEATIDGDTYFTTTPSIYGTSTYVVEIVQPQGKNYDGKTVAFKIGNLAAAQTGTWQAAANVELNLTAGVPPPAETCDLPYGLDEDPMAVNFYQYPVDAVPITLAEVEDSMPDELVVIWYYGGPSVGWQFFKPGWGTDNTLTQLLPGRIYIGIVTTASSWEISQYSILTPTPIRAGEWVAITQFGELRFVVNTEGTAILEIFLSFDNFRCEDESGWVIHNGSTKVTYNTPKPIVDGVFDTTISEYGGGWTTIHGEFDVLGTHASGTWEIGTNGIVCSGTWESP